MDPYVSFKTCVCGGVKKTLRNTNGGSWQMLTFDDKGGGGVKKSQKPAYVIHGCSLFKYDCILNFEMNPLTAFSFTYQFKIR